jgi:sugar transferase (PEP-CTERM/EpsH1 system associated)
VAVRILFAAAYLPYPPDSGGRARSYHLLRWMAERHAVHLLAFCHDPADLDRLPVLERLCASVRTVPAPAYPLGPRARLRRALFSPADLVMPRRSAQKVPADQAGMAAAIAASPPFDLAFLDDLGVAEYARLFAGVRTILSKHNVEADLYRQLARAKRPLSPAWALAHLEARALARYEGPTAALFRQVIVVSDQERARLAVHCPAGRIVVVPNGVDTTYFAPQPAVTEEPDSIVFVGTFFWAPNIDAARLLVGDILPRICRELSGVRLCLVGHDPPPEVQALAHPPDVIVAGSVPDVRPYLARAAVCVVPLRIGGGTRLKILDALAMGRPVVSTSLASEGLDLAGGHELQIADGAEAFAAATVRLLRDPAQRATLGAAGRRAVEGRYTWSAVLAGLETLLAGEGLR